MINPSINPNDISKTVTKTFEQANALVSGYVQAATKSSAAALQGFEHLAHNMNELMQEQISCALGFGKGLSAVRTPQEAADAHAEYLKDSFDTIVAGSNKISEISLHAAKSAIDPLSQHANEAIGAVMKQTRNA